jgi:hypothetical protein
LENTGLCEVVVMKHDTKYEHICAGAVNKTQSVC